MMSDSERVQKANELENAADELEALAERVREDPGDTVLSKHFHEVRTGGGPMYSVALFAGEDGVESGDVKPHQEGSHYRHEQADAILTMSSQPLMESDHYGQRAANELKRKARAARANAGSYRDAAREDPRK